MVATLCLMLSLLLFLKCTVVPDRRRYLFWSVGLYASALLAKEVAVLQLPLMIGYVVVTRPGPAPEDRSNYLGSSARQVVKMCTAYLDRTRLQIRTLSWPRFAVRISASA
jgi:hypothetical protein